MVYKPKARFQVALRWLPVEILLVGISLTCAWLINSYALKPTFKATTSVTIQRDYRGKSKKKVITMQREDIKNVTQFNVVPRQRWVLYSASEYAYMHYGIWQNITDLSESVSATAVPKKPKLEISVVSSSRMVAKQNLVAFRYAVANSLETLDGYDIKTTDIKVVSQNNPIQKSIYKYALIVGLVLAVMAPYVIEFVRGEGKNEQNK